MFNIIYIIKYFISNYIKVFVPGSKKKQQLTLRWDFLGGNFLEQNFETESF